MAPTATATVLPGVKDTRVHTATTARRLDLNAEHTRCTGSIDMQTHIDSYVRVDIGR